ncbi:glycosyltransferase family 25 protein [Photorhabdus akhurstii]|uniref:glycosyltransferase family 25 protein n=1 Tax=Photorhabdus akhurstii TaxID=171438 RepID=UPI00370452F3
MRVFIINLKSNIERKEAMRQQSNKIGLQVEFIEAVYGASMSNEELTKVVYDYPDCKLTKGEIGCSLSHLFIYEKMLRENIAHTLILEDDAILPNKIYNVISEIESMDDIKKPNVYLLNKVETYINNRKIKSNVLDIYQAYEASGTHGYLINKTAAKELLEKLQPIKYEADMWGIFRFRNFINLYCTIPHVINTSDERKFDSFIEKERNVLREEREYYRHKLKKQEPNYQFYRLKDLFLRKFIYKIENVT